jgi:allantoate deiminase
VLEDRKLAVGVVSAIASQTRGRLTFRGKAGHAGTTPMDLRRDALAGAAEFVLAAETYAAARPPLVATVGTINVPSGAANVIPGETGLSLDVRHPQDAACRRAVTSLVAQARKIAHRRGLSLTWQPTMLHHATPCAPALTKQLEQSVKAVQGKSLSLVSGAGHDGVVMAALTPIAMLFVRCRDGLSHHPDEYASPQDLAVALEVTVDFLQRLAADYMDEHG